MFELKSDKIANMDDVELCEVIDNRITLDKQDTEMVLIMTGKIKYLPKTYNKFTVELDEPEEIEKLYKFVKRDLENTENPLKKSSVSVKCVKEELDNFKIGDRIKIATSVNIYFIEGKNYISFNLEQIKKEKKLYF